MKNHRFLKKCCKIKKFKYLNEKMAKSVSFKKS